MRRLPSVVKRTSRKSQTTKREVDDIARCRNNEKTNRSVCSWPNSSSSNRFMLNVNKHRIHRSSFVGANQKREKEHNQTRSTHLSPKVAETFSKFRARIVSSHRHTRITNLQNKTIGRRLEILNTEKKWLRVSEERIRCEKQREGKAGTQKPP